MKNRRFMKTLSVALILGLLVFGDWRQVRGWDGAKDAPQENRLSLKRIFEAREFRAEGYAATWSAAGNILWRWEAAAQGAGRDLVRIDARSGDRQVVVPAADLIPPGADRPLDVEGDEWSKNGDKLLIFTGSQRVWRYKTRGDYWVYDRTSRILQRLGGTAPAGSLMFAKFSPDGNSVAYVHNGEILLESLLDHSIRSLTPTDSTTLIHGTFDWVYEEELSARDGFRWSPDGQAIAFWQIDTSGVPLFTLVNNTDGFYPTVHQFAYPKTGQRNPAAKIGVVDVAGGSIKWLPIPGDPRKTICAAWSGMVQKRSSFSSSTDYKTQTQSFE